MKRLTLKQLAKSATTIGPDFFDDPRATLRDSPTDPGVLAPIREDVDMLDTLGVGGMAIVHLAHQASLEREIAVKTLRQDRAGPEASRLLLHEARVTGALQHPNVVPVHDVRVDEHGNPQILLKRIRGESWSTLLREGSMGLAEHVRILCAVCNALEFAHAQGVLHRDVKPSNVMVGEYGEVLLVDWGIAVRTDDEGVYRSVTQRLVGTPAYMSPEMVAVGDQDPRTDIYLLGAVLYELLVGEPPHTGTTLAEMLESWFTPGSLPEDAPSILVTLCEGALSLDPADRPDAVATVREELTRYLDLRAMDELVEAARLQLAEVSDRSLEALDAFHAARFTCRQALRTYPGHTIARRCLDDALLLAAEVYLAREDFDAARRALAERSEPHVLSQVVAERARERTADDARVAEQLAQSDTQSGRAVRARIFGGGGLAFAALLVWVTLWGVPASYGGTTVVSAVMICGVTAGAWSVRDELRELPFERTTFLFLLGLPVSMECVALGAALQGWPAAQLESVGTMLVAVWCGFAAAWVRQPSLLWGSVFWVCAWLGVSAAPAYALGVNVVGGLLSAMAFVALWRDPDA